VKLGGEESENSTRLFWGKQKRGKRVATGFVVGKQKKVRAVGGRRPRWVQLKLGLRWSSTHLGHLENKEKKPYEEATTHRREGRVPVEREGQPKLSGFEKERKFKKGHSVNLQKGQIRKGRGTLSSSRSNKQHPRRSTTSRSLINRRGAKEKHEPEGMHGPEKKEKRKPDCQG